MNDRENIARASAAAFERMADTMQQRGVSDAEIGKALVAAGLSRWSRAIGAAALTEQLAQITTAMGEAAGVDMTADAILAHTKH